MLPKYWHLDMCAYLHALGLISSVMELVTVALHFATQSMLVSPVAAYGWQLLSVKFRGRYYNIIQRE